MWVCQVYKVCTFNACIMTIRNKYINTRLILCPLWFWITTYYLFKTLLGKSLTIILTWFQQKLSSTIFKMYTIWKTFYENIGHNSKKRRDYRNGNYLLIQFYPINLPLFSTVFPSNICMFLSCRPFVVITVNCPS